MLLIDAAARSAGVPCTGGSTETEEAGASAPNIVDTIAHSGGSAGGLRSSQCMVSLGKIARLCGEPGTQLVAAFVKSGGEDSGAGCRGSLYQDIRKACGRGSTAERNEGNDGCHNRSEQQDGRVAQLHLGFSVLGNKNLFFGERKLIRFSVLIGLRRQTLIHLKT